MTRRSNVSKAITVLCFTSLLAAGSCLAPGEAGKETAKTVAKEALGPAGTVVDAGEVVLNSGITIAGAKMQNDADTALAEAALYGGAERDKKADFLQAKADCFNRGDCKRWYELTGDPKKGKKSGVGNY